MEHPVHFLSIRDYKRRFFLGNDFHASADLHLRLKLIVRTVRESQMVDVLRREMTAESLSDIRRNRDARLSDLMTEHQLIVAPESPRDSVTVLSEIH